MVIGDDHLAFGQRIGLAVQRQQGFPGTCGADHKVTVDLRRVEDVQGPVQAKCEVVGDIHQSRDRAQSDGLQPRGKPVGRGAVLDTPDHATGEMRAALGLQRGVDANSNGRGEAAHNRGGGNWLQLAQPPRGKIARNAVDTQRVGAVWSDFDFHDRVIRAPIVDIARAKRCIGGKVDDPVVIVRQHQLAFRAKHPVAVHTPDITGLEINSGAGNMRARRGKDPDKPGFRVRCAADDLHLLGPAAGAIGEGFYPADAQTVGIGVLHSLDYTTDAESAQLGRWVLDPLDLKAQIGQRVGQRVDRGRGLKVIFQPGESEFHLCGSRSSAAPDLAQRGRKGKRGQPAVAQRCRLKRPIRIG